MSGKIIGYIIEEEKPSILGGLFVLGFVIGMFIPVYFDVKKEDKIREVIFEQALVEKYKFRNSELQNKYVEGSKEKLLNGDKK